MSGMNIENFDYTTEICNWGIEEDADNLNSKRANSHRHNNDNFANFDNDQQKLRHSAPASSIPAAKAVTFSASTINNQNLKKEQFKPSIDYFAEEDEEELELPAISPTYACHPKESPTSLNMDNLAPLPSSTSPRTSPRDRTNTLESELTSDSSIGADSTSGFSKKMLVKLMREQVNLVRDLTNAQIANKKELEKMKEERDRLEAEKRERDAADRALAGQNYPNGLPPSGPSGSRLNLPPTVQRDTSDSRSVSSKSFIDRFRDLRGEFQNFQNYHRPQQSSRRDMSYPRQHPDAKYYQNRSRAFSNDTYGQGEGRNRVYSTDTYGDTVNNGGVSMASTILPTNITVGQDYGHPNMSPGNMSPGSPNMHPNANVHPSQTFMNPMYNRDKIEITPIPERNVVPPPHDTCFNKLWIFFSHLCTLFIPDALLCCIGRHAKIAKDMTMAQKEEVKKVRGEAKQAWREKVAIFWIMLMCSAAFIGVSGLIPVLLCRETSVFTMDEIRARDRTEDWTVIFGHIYDIAEYIPLHPGGNLILDAVAADASKVFPRRPLGRLPDKCMNPNVELTTEVACNDFNEVDKLVDLHCHTSIVGFNGVNKAFGKYLRGDLAHRPQNLKNDVHTEYIMIYNRIYNVTSYMDGITDPNTGKIDVDSENAYLNKDLTSLIVNKRGEDATGIYEALYKDDVALSCLDDLFYVGVLDEPPDLVCQILNYTMYTIMILIAVVLAVQCLCSLIYLFRRKRTILRDDTRSKIIVMVPCYNEGDKELRKTIDSVMDTSYPDDNKVLLVVADGNITGKGEKRSTPETLSKILGYKMTPKDRTYKCKSIGDLSENRAKLYQGTMKDCGKELKYIVIVKTGVASEKGSARAGNRGKRDSQLLFTGLLNRFHHGRKLNDLDVAMKNALDGMQVPLDEVRYLMAIDADTRVDRDSISHMTISMNKNDHILALCGETKVENKAQSWVTMIQVFEYYTNHHMKKAFESVFGCVTCLPGCFTMYRLYSDDGRPLLSCDDVYQRYSTNNVNTLHEKNLYHLGEDRMLTTLLLRYFPDMRLSFVPEAHCYTIVPHTFSILLSQRRRWINSTFHNMLELVRVNTMCGICCLSMKSVVVLDLIATLILPASLIYVGYIVYITFWMGEPVSMLMMVVWGIVMGVQVICFLLRSRWDYWWWFFVFILLGVPVFYFILPIYSFWHMDDFSWGATRQVSGEKSATPVLSKDETECSGSPGIEVTADDFHHSTKQFSTTSSRTPIHHNPPHGHSQSHSRRSHEYESRPIDVDEDLRKYSTTRNHHAPPIDLDDITMDEFTQGGTTKHTEFDPNKYRDAEEAKHARRLRRGEC